MILGLKINGKKLAIFSVIFLMLLIAPIMISSQAPIPGEAGSSVSPAGALANSNSDNTETKSGGIEETLGNILGWIFFTVASALGWLVSIMIEVMAFVAGYNKFLEVEAVSRGWELVRDVCNNFFIVILMIIAVATILRIPQYQYQQLLPRLLVMAVLINFSKMFAGIMIDFSQILMLTFVGSLQSVEGRNIILGALGLTDLFQLHLGGGGLFSSGGIATLARDAGTQIQIWDILVALIFALMVTVVALVVITIITVILVFRIIMLWFLVILSPLAFLATTFPRGQKYAGQWWEEMSKYLVIGPVLVFFLWVSLSVMSKIADPSYLDPGTLKFSEEWQPKKSPDAVFEPMSKMASGEGVFNFLIVIGLMVGSLIMAQKSGVAGASFASKGIANLQNWGKKGAGFALKPVKKAGEDAKEGAAGLMKGTAAGIDKLTGGVAGKAVRGVTGAAVGAAVGAAALGPVGVAVGAAAGLLRGSGLMNKINTKLKKNRLHKEAVIKASIEPKDKGESLDEKGNQVEIKIDNDKKRVRQKWDNKRGGFVEGRYNQQDIWEPDKDILRGTDGKEVTQKINDAKFINKKGEKVNKDQADYQWDSKKNRYIGKGDNIRLARDDQGKMIHRFDNELELEGKLYRRIDQKDKNFYQIDEKGEFMKDSQNRLIAATHDKKEVKAMSEGAVRFWSGYLGASNKSGIAADTAEEEKIKKLQGNYANMDRNVLRKIFETETDRTKKMALALTLAIKEGFKTKDQVKKAKESFGGNRLLIDQFSDAVDKRQAHLHYDLDTAEGRAKFNRRQAAGKIDILEDKAHESDMVIKTFQEGLTPEEFRDYLSRASRVSRNKADAIKVGLAKGIKPDEAILDLHGELDAKRLVNSLITGNLGVSFTTDDVAAHEEEINKGLAHMMRKFRPRDFANLELENFDAEAMKKHFNNDLNQAKKFIELLEGQIRQTIDQNILSSIRLLPNVETGLVDKLKEIKKNNDSSVDSSGGGKKSKPTQSGGGQTPPSVTIPPGSVGGGSARIKNYP